jgi:hypothetical protein
MLGENSHIPSGASPRTIFVISAHIKNGIIYWFFTFREQWPASFKKLNAPILQNYHGASMSSCNAMPCLALPVLRMGFAPGAHTLKLIRPAPVTSVFRFGVPVFLAQRLAGFFTVWCRTKKLAMATPGIGNEYLFAANAPALMVFHIKHHRKPLCWHN